MVHTTVKECLALYHALKADVTNLDPYWNFVNCSRRALGMGVWEDAYLEAKDTTLKEFREKGLILQDEINGLFILHKNKFTLTKPETCKYLKKIEIYKRDKKVFLIVLA